LKVNGLNRPFRVAAGSLRLSDEAGAPQALEDLAVDLAESARADCVRRRPPY
jgi:hypothetical protein